MGLAVDGDVGQSVDDEGGELWVVGVSEDGLEALDGSVPVGVEVALDAPAITRVHTLGRLGLL